VSGLARRPFLLAALSLALVGLVYELLPSDESRIADLLAELCSLLNQTRDPASLARLRQLLRRVLMPEARLRVSELDQDLEGASLLVLRSGELLSSAPLSFALNSVAIHLSGKLARVDCDLIVTVRGSGEQRRDLRHTRVRLVKHGDAWRIEAAEVDAVAPSEPEARP